MSSDLNARTKPLAEGMQITSPVVGIWRGGPENGALVRPGQPIGWIVILGRARQLRAPVTAHGVVGNRLDAAERSVVVDFDKVLFDLTPVGNTEAVESQVAPAPTALGSNELIFRASSAGRFYSRSAPDRPPFVSVGDKVAIGQTVFLLEVMKTFTRIAYGGHGLPESATVKRILVTDGDDVDAGDPILELEQA